MKIQSISIDVPINGKCLNKCKFCVSRMHDSPYQNRICQSSLMDDDENIDYKVDYKKRLHWAKENGINTVILTGTAEPIQNKVFLQWFSDINKEFKFDWIELQTSGNLLLNKDTSGNYYNLNFLKMIGVSTISLSISDLFNSKNNGDIIDMPIKHRFFIGELCKVIKDNNFNLRLSLNMSDVYNKFTFNDIFTKAKELNADQITFRKLFSNENGTTPQDIWINEHQYSNNKFNLLTEYIKSNGVLLGILPFGAKKYSVEDISIVIDDNCLDDVNQRAELDTYKYIILRPNCKLYTSWVYKSSLVF